MYLGSLKYLVWDGYIVIITVVVMCPRDWVYQPGISQPDQMLGDRESCNTRSHFSVTEIGVSFSRVGSLAECKLLPFISINSKLSLKFIRYYSPRMKGLEIQVFTISLSLTSTFTVLFYKRKKMPFKFKVLNKSK